MAAEPDRSVRPLGLPSGSIRAILALTLVGLVCYQTALGRETGLLLSEALMIVLAHYFAARRVVALPPDIERELEHRGTLVREANPLWLPRGTVRLVILVAFGLLAMLLAVEGRLLDPVTIGSVGLIFAFLLGVVLRWLRRGGPRRTRPVRASVWMHIKAALVLATCAVIVVITLADGTAPFENLLLAFVLFYFGSR